MLIGVQARLKTLVMQTDMHWVFTFRMEILTITTSLADSALELLDLSNK